jgi:hypothetical protein
MMLHRWRKHLDKAPRSHVKAEKKDSKGLYWGVKNECVAYIYALSHKGPPFFRYPPSWFFFLAVALEHLRSSCTPGRRGGVLGVDD